jgi:prepilin-type processing-associated H-X9-DG protein
MAIIALLAALLLPTLSKGKRQAREASCINNLHQEGLAFHAFAHDHESHFPMQVPAEAGGSMDYLQTSYYQEANSYNSFRHFQTLSNELTTPRLLVCPEDKRSPASSFGTLSNENLSYFVGIKADYGQADSILAGDRNITNDWLSTGTLVYWGPFQRIHWTEELHNGKGNLLFADGRVERKNNPTLTSESKAASKAQVLIRPLTPPATVAAPDLPSDGPPATTMQAGNPNSSTFVIPKGKVKVGPGVMGPSKSDGGMMKPVPAEARISLVQQAAATAIKPPAPSGIPLEAQPAESNLSALPHPAPPPAVEPTAPSPAPGPPVQEETATLEPLINWGSWLALLLILLLLLMAFIFWAAGKIRNR